jgi:isopenicillin N synthase-like dioxygenase
VNDEGAPYKPVMGRNKWPSQEFRVVYQEYVERLLELGRTVMKAIALGLGVREGYFDEYVDESFWVLRAIGYPPLEAVDEGGISCGEHTGRNPVACTD